MKNGLGWLPLVISLTTVPLQAEEISQSNALQASNKAVRDANDQVKIARQEYLTAVQKYGATDPQSVQAKMRLDRSRDEWKKKVIARRQVRRQVYNDLKSQPPHTP